VKVVVAVITDEQQRILITQRPLHAPHGGYWEFPGGKLEVGESAEHALIREIKEEVGLDVHQYKLLGHINHDYADKSVQLIVFHVTSFTGTPSRLEGQLDMQWIARERINPELFPEANRKIFDLMKSDYPEMI